VSRAVPEKHREVLDAPYGVLTTLGRDGYPQTTMVAFLAEDDLIKLSLNTTRQKTRNLMARPRATLLIPDPASPYRTLEIRGDIEVTPRRRLRLRQARRPQVRRDRLPRRRPAGRGAGRGGPAPGPSQRHRPQASARLVAPAQLFLVRRCLGGREVLHRCLP
jgi:PPOX class probable F420-dependent enzyme